MTTNKYNEALLMERIAILCGEAEDDGDMVLMVLCDLALGTLEAERLEWFDESTPMLFVVKGYRPGLLMQEHIDQLTAMDINTMTKERAIELCAKALQERSNA